MFCVPFADALEPPSTTLMFKDLQSQGAFMISSLSSLGSEGFACSSLDPEGGCLAYLVWALGVSKSEKHQGTVTKSKGPRWTTKKLCFFWFLGFRTAISSVLVASLNASTRFYRSKQLGGLRR